MSDTADSMEELNAQFRAEDAEDEKAFDVPRSQRNVTAHADFANASSTPRTLDGKPYDEYEG